MRTKLTEKKIRSLTATGAPADILHERTPGAGLRITALGAKIWFYLYRSPSLRDERGQAKQRRAYLGYHPSGRRPDRQPSGRDLSPMSLDQFETAYDVFRGEIAKGNDPQSRGLVPADTARWIASEALPAFLQPLYPEGYREGSFAALLVDYFQHAARNLKPRTVDDYRQTAKAFAQVLGSRIPGEISGQEVQAILSSVERRAPQMARHVKKVLSACFEYGRTHWFLQGNPAREGRVTVRKVKRDRWLTDSELVTVLAALEKLSDRKASDVYRLVLYSMCRPGEAAYATAEDLVLLNGERVWRIRGKNGREFLVPLVGPIAEILNRRYLEVGGKGALFWPRSSTSFYPNQLKDANAQFRKITNLNDVRPHDLRRTGRTHVAGLGVAESVAEALLNHVKGEIEGTYNLYDYWVERKQALACWHEKLAGLASQAREQAAAA